MSMKAQVLKCDPRIKTEKKHLPRLKMAVKFKQLFYPFSTIMYILS